MPTSLNSQHEVAWPSGDLLDWQKQDFSALANKILRAGPIQSSRGQQQSVDDHLDMLAREFSGQPVLCFLHAALTVHIRRDLRRGEALEAYYRLWDSQSDFLISRLNMRWLISACDTFADFSRSQDEGMAALAGTLFGNTVKLYETERFATNTGSPPYQPIEGRSRLFDGMTPFIIGSGNMVANLDSRLHNAKLSDSPALRIVRELWHRLHAHDSVFRRFARTHTETKTQWLPQARKIALFNDTSAAGHYGGIAVMEAIENLFGSAGATIIHRHTAGSDWRNNPQDKSAIDGADIVLVNGDDSIHQGSLEAERLASIGTYCRDIGKPCFLINATLQDNDDDITEHLRCFDHIWVRETGSSHQLRALGIDHSLCPDLSLTRNVSPSGLASQQLLFIDSVVSDVMTTLKQSAQPLDQPIYVIKRDQSGQVLAVTPGTDTPSTSGPCPTPTTFLRLMSTAERVVTGRFHAACFCLMLRLPFHAYSSNTFKIESMLEDIGLRSARMLKADSRLPEPLPFSDDELIAIDEYLHAAEDSAHRMVERILLR